MSVPWPLFWPALTFVLATLIALALRGVALTGLRRWAPAPSSWTSIADAIRVQSLLWCVVLGLYVANEVARVHDALWLLKDGRETRRSCRPGGTNGWGCCLKSA